MSRPPTHGTPVAPSIYLEAGISVPIKAILRMLNLAVAFELQIFGHKKFQKMPCDELIR